MSAEHSKGPSGPKDINILDRSLFDKCDNTSGLLASFIDNDTNVNTSAVSLFNRLTQHSLVGDRVDFGRVSFVPEDCNTMSGIICQTIGSRFGRSTHNSRHCFTVDHRSMGIKYQTTSDRSCGEMNDVLLEASNAGRIISGACPGISHADVSRVVNLSISAAPAGVTFSNIWARYFAIGEVIAKNWQFPLNSNAATNCSGVWPTDEGQWNNTLNDVFRSIGEGHDYTFIRAPSRRVTLDAASVGLLWCMMGERVSCTQTIGGRGIGLNCLFPQPIKIVVVGAVNVVAGINNIAGNYNHDDLEAAWSRLGSWLLCALDDNSGFEQAAAAMASSIMHPSATITHAPTPLTQRIAGLTADQVKRIALFDILRTNIGGRVALTYLAHGAVAGMRNYFNNNDVSQPVDAQLLVILSMVDHDDDFTEASRTLTTGEVAKILTFIGTHDLFALFSLGLVNSVANIDFDMTSLADREQSFPSCHWVSGLNLQQSDGLRKFFTQDITPGVSSYGRANPMMLLNASQFVGNLYLLSQGLRCISDLVVLHSSYCLLSESARTGGTDFLGGYSLNAAQFSSHLCDSLPPADVCADFSRWKSLACKFGLLTMNATHGLNGSGAYYLPDHVHMCYEPVCYSADTRLRLFGSTIGFHGNAASNAKFEHLLNSHKLFTCKKYNDVCREELLNYMCQMADRSDNVLKFELDVVHTLGDEIVQFEAIDLSDLCYGRLDDCNTFDFSRCNGFEFSTIIIPGRISGTSVDAGRKFFSGCTIRSDCISANNVDNNIVVQDGALCFGNATVHAALAVSQRVLQSTLMKIGRTCIRVGGNVDLQHKKGPDLCMALLVNTAFNLAGAAYTMRSYAANGGYVGIRGKSGTGDFGVFSFRCGVPRFVTLLSGICDGRHTSDPPDKDSSDKSGAGVAVDESSRGHVDGSA